MKRRALKFNYVTPNNSKKRKPRSKNMSASSNQWECEDLPSNDENNASKANSLPQPSGIAPSVTEPVMRELNVASKVVFHKPDPFPTGLAAARKYEAWALWKQQFSVAIELAGDISQRTMANYLTLSAGDEVRQLVHTMNLLPDKTAVEENFPFYTNMLSKLDAHFKSSSDLTIDLGAFNAMSQGPKEGARDFYMRLLRQAALCDLSQHVALVKGRFIEGMKDKDVARRAYSEDWELENIVNVASRSEAAEAFKPRGWSADAGRSIEVAAVSGFKRREPVTNTRKRKTVGKPWERQVSRSKEECTACGIAGHGNKCPAVGRSCTICNKMGHFRKVCPKRIDLVVEKKEVAKEQEVKE